MVDCKEMNTLVSQVAHLVTSKAPHASPKQRFVDLAMRAPKSCVLMIFFFFFLMLYGCKNLLIHVLGMSICELIDHRIAESVCSGVFLLLLLF